MRSVLLLLSIFFLRPCSAQNTSGKNDFPFNRFHVYFGLDFGLSPIGNTFDVYNQYPFRKFDTHGFTGNSALETITGELWSIGLEYNLTDRIRIGLNTLPDRVKNFQGAIGTFGTDPNSAYSGAKFKDGQMITEYIWSKSGLALHGDYVIIPYQRKKEYGFEWSAGAGMFVNYFDVSTYLYAVDSTAAQPLPSVGIEDTKFCYGLIANTRINFYLDKWLSVFANGYGGYGSAIHLAAKSQTTGSVTAYAPAHDERLGGFSFSIGLGFHLYDVQAKVPASAE
ncbi:MAG TPA: hypothetical protein VL651_09535 [Bacteroidia bacterium]|nr:hypothetical protein [Bacteroidia bacterium]